MSRTASSGTTSPGGFSIRTDEQGLTAYLVRDQAANTDQITVKAVLDLMTAQNIALDADIEARVAEAVRELAGDAPGTAEVVVAQGRKAEHGQPGELIWSERCNPERPAARQGEQFDHYASRLVSVAAGQTIAHIEPPTPGTPGQTVYGAPIEARPGSPASVTLRGGCHLDEATGTIVTDVSGTLHVKRDEIRVSEMLHIGGNVNFETGHVDAPGDVEIEGNVVDLFQVCSGGNVTVRGEVQASFIRADGDVEITRALANQRKGVCLAGGNLRVRLIENSIAAAGGDISVGREVIQSDVFAGGALDCSSGGICGGIAVARGRISAKVLGSDGGVRTIAAAGVDWMVGPRVAPLLVEAEEIAKELEKKEGPLATLKANLKRLTPQQREQVTELEFRVMELQARRDELIDKTEQFRAQGREMCLPEVTISKMIHQGAQLRLGNLVADVLAPIRGPASFRPAEVLDIDKPVIVKISAGGSHDTLPARIVTNPLHDIALPELPPESDSKPLITGV